MSVRQYLGQIFEILCSKWWYGSNLAIAMGLHMNRNSLVEPYRVKIFQNQVNVVTNIYH